MLICLVSPYPFMTANGSNLTTITKTIGSTSYVKTLTYTGDVLTGVSVWAEA